jgi:pyruvate kinase
MRALANMRGMRMRREVAEAAQPRKTKIVCTIGPTSCSREDLFRLADSVPLPYLPLPHAAITCALCKKMPRNACMSLLPDCKDKPWGFQARHKADGASEEQAMRMQQHVPVRGTSRAAAVVMWPPRLQGMNVARLNMSHGDHKSHKAVVDLVKEYNLLGRGNVAIMLDTKGPEVRSGDLAEPIDMKPGALPLVC